MTAPVEAGLIAMLVVLFAGFAAAMVARAVNDRRPLPPAIPLVPFDAPEDEQPTLGVRIEVVRRAVADAQRRRLLHAPDYSDATWSGAR